MVKGSLQYVQELGKNRLRKTMLEFLQLQILRRTNLQQNRTRFSSGVFAHRQPARITGHYTANQVSVGGRARVCVCVSVCSPVTHTTHIPTCTNQPKAMLSFIADKLHIDFTVWTGDWGTGWAGELTIEFSPWSDDRIPAVLLDVRKLSAGISQVGAQSTIFNTSIVCMCDWISGEQSWSCSVKLLPSQ